jgi:hypothetical protein
MKTFAVLLIGMASITSASAQGAGNKINEFLSKGWEPFAAQYLPSFRLGLEGALSDQPVNVIFLRKKGGVVRCVRGVANPALGFCDIIGGGQD